MAIFGVFLLRISPPFCVLPFFSSTRVRAWTNEPGLVARDGRRLGNSSGGAVLSAYDHMLLFSSLLTLHSCVRNGRHWSFWAACGSLGEGKVFDVVCRVYQFETM